MKLYNSLTKKVEEFKPIEDGKVGMYTCGPTVYEYAHIGHGRKYVYDDLLRRTLEYFGYDVNHVQNVTDVGHLVSDADEGEDKLEKGAKKQGKTVWEVADYFTKEFYLAMDKLNNLPPKTICKATDYIPEQIEMVKTLVHKGFAYDTREAVYFDVSKFPSYSKLFGQSLEEKQVATRLEVKTDENKRNPQDFALWFKRVGRFADHAMHWESPWGEGFPGWHIECSAMSVKYLGEQFDIHTGGEDHLPVHHPNEIAQSEAATGKSPFVKYWVHYAFLMVDGTKMSKSLGNFYTVDDVVEKGFDPMDLRYFYLTAHYKKQQNFTFEALEAAKSARKKLVGHMMQFKNSAERKELSEEKLEKINSLRDQFSSALAEDLNMPQALGVVWEVVKSNIPDLDKYDLINSFDEVLALRLNEVEEIEIPDRVNELLSQREIARREGNFDKADALRKEIEGQGFVVLDSGSKSSVKSK